MFEALGKEGADDSSAMIADRAVDLGCGSGLSGAELRRHVGYLTGVDLNPEMAKEARDRGCYDRIVVGDAKRLQSEDSRGGGVGEYDLVFACDLLPYLRDLRPMFNAIREILDAKGGGTFAFSAEIMNESPDGPNGVEGEVGAEGFVLQSCARFAHRRGYIRDLVEEFGFEVLASKESTILRQHDEKDVLGALMVLSVRGGPKPRGG